MFSLIIGICLIVVSYASFFMIPGSAIKIVSSFSLALFGVYFLIKGIFSFVIPTLIFAIVLGSIVFMILFAHKMIASRS